MNTDRLFVRVEMKADVAIDRFVKVKMKPEVLRDRFAIVETI